MNPKVTSCMVQYIDFGLCERFTTRKGGSMIGWNSTQVLSFCEETEARFNRYSLRTNISVVLKKFRHITHSKK